MKMLQISDSLSLPLESVSRTFGLLAARGAGKSNAAAVMAEEMFAAQLPFVVIDPVGSWYGLRSSEDGTKPGLTIPIFGGKHGDVPLDRSNGVLMADLIVSKRLSCVLDLSTFESESAKKQFLIDFARQLYLKNEDPLHLFLEEADDYIPQKPIRDELQLLRAWENIVRRGRSRGLGMTMITQRSAVINKSVLTQVETLFALRTTGPQDIAAIREWVRYHQAGDEVISTLAELKDGDAWVWSPNFLGVMKRVHIRRRRTFDSGATPKNFVGSGKRPAATLADVNLEDIKTQLSATIEKIKQDDPKELRRRLNLLQLELNALKSTATTSNESKLSPAKLEAARRESQSYMEENKRLQREVVHLRSILKKLHAATVDYFGSDNRAIVQTHPVEAVPRLALPVVGYEPDERSQRDFRESRMNRVAIPNSSPAVFVTVPVGGLRRIMTALAQFRSRTMKQLAHLSGISPKSSTMRGHMAHLRRESLIREADGVIELTAAGYTALGDFDPLPTGSALRDHWRKQLGDSATGKVFSALIECYPKAADKEYIAARSGISAESSTMRGALAALRKRDLVSGSSQLIASSTLFE